MNYYKLFVLLFCVSFSVFAQDSKRVLFPFNFYDSWGFINSKGEIIVEPIYEEAFNFHDGLAKVRLNGYFGFVDTTGKLVIPNTFEMVGDFHYGVAIAHKGSNSFYINKKGETLFGGYLTLHDFQKDGYATIFTRSGNFFIVNKKGNIIKEGSNFINTNISEKKTSVYLNKYGDLKEKYESKFDDIDYNQAKEFGDYLVYSYSDNHSGKVYSTKYGVANLKKGFVTFTQFDGINIETLTDDLIQIQQGKNYRYINQTGKLVYVNTQKYVSERYGKHLGKTNDEILQQFDISYHREAKYEAGSIGNMPVLRSYGGWRPSKNIFKKITSIYNFKPNALSIIVDNERNDIFEETYEGYKFYITNNTKDSIFFEAYNSNLNVVMQAKYCNDDCDDAYCDANPQSDWEGDREGHWQDIEYSQIDLKENPRKRTFHFFNKHAFHRLYLIPKTYWEFTIPKYHGVIKTKLRLKLKYKTQRDVKEIIIYSNVFDGSINPAQFWYHKNTNNKMTPDLGH